MKWGYSLNKYYGNVAHRKVVLMQSYEIRKIANAIIYWIDNNVEHMGKVKLMKLMFYADKYHLENFGRSIFGHQYSKLPRGPVPELTRSVLEFVINKNSDEDHVGLVEEFTKYIDVEPAKRFGYSSVKFFGKQEFSERIFSKSEIQALKFVVDSFKHLNGEEISEISHQTKAWKDTEMYEPIDFSLMVENSENMKEYINFWETEKVLFERQLS